MMKLKDMRMGTFKGMTALNKKDPSRSVSTGSRSCNFMFMLNQRLSACVCQIQDFAKRNRLDAQAAVKLAEVPG